MSEFKKVTMLINENTGEIVAENEKDYNAPIWIKFKEKHRFTKAYHIDMVEFENKTYYKYFYVCICNLEAGTNRVINHGTEMYNGTSMIVKELANKCDTSERTIYNFLEYCMNKKIIRKMDLDNEFFGYFINPIYVFNGQYIQPILYMMFKGYGIDEYMNKSSIKLLDEYCSSFNIKEVIYNTYKNNPTIN